MTSALIEQLLAAYAAAACGNDVLFTQRAGGTA